MNKYPSSADKNPERRAIGNWISGKRQAYHQGTLSKFWINKFEQTFPEWSWSPASEASERVQKTKIKFLEMARKGEPKPKTKFDSSALSNYTNKNNKLYDAETPYVDVRNRDQDFRLGDSFEVSIDNRALKNVPAKLYSFVMRDINASEVLIGSVGVEFDQPREIEDYSYRVPNVPIARMHNDVGTDVRGSSFPTANRVPTAKYMKLSKANVMKIT